MVDSLCRGRGRQAFSFFISLVSMAHPLCWLLATLVVLVCPCVCRRSLRRDLNANQHSSLNRPLNAIFFSLNSPFSSPKFGDEANFKTFSEDKDDIQFSPFCAIPPPQTASDMDLVIVSPCSCQPLPAWRRTITLLSLTPNVERTLSVLTAFRNLVSLSRVFTTI